MAQRDDLLVWIDLEMTSLVDPRVDSITQLAAIITDKDLNVVAEGEEITIHADPEQFEHIPEDTKEVYRQSGLIPSIVASTVTEAEAEERVLAFVSAYVARGTSPLCGNSIYNDRMFLKFRMPTLNEHLHYRNIDVSTFKELARRWRPELYAEAQQMKAHKTHHALDDIRGSIAELKLYRERWLK
ncbi:MAG: oligoribonuclease [Candidatus Pacebacteria bacterium]|nr:oligoribonuclease [Candidatus Paceibacterota bacterium]